MAAAQREHLLVDQFFAVLALGAGDGDAAVVAQFDGGREGDGDAQGERLAGGDLDFGRRDHFQAFALERFLHGLGQHPLGGFLEDGVDAERALNDLAGCFAFAEAGDAVALGEAARGLIERALDALVVQLDVEHDLSFGDAFRSDLHSPTTRSHDAGARCCEHISAPGNAPVRAPGESERGHLPRGLSTSLTASPSRLKASIRISTKNMGTSSR